MAGMLEENKITNKRKADEFLLLKFHQHGRCQEEWVGVFQDQLKISNWGISKDLKSIKLGKCFTRTRTMIFNNSNLFRILT